MISPQAATLKKMLKDLGHGSVQVRTRHDAYGYHEASAVLENLSTEQIDAILADKYTGMYTSDLGTQTLHRVSYPWSVLD